MTSSRFLVSALAAVCILGGALLGGCAQSGTSTLPQVVANARLVLAVLSGAAQAATDQGTLSPETATKVAGALAAARTSVSLAEQAVAVADQPTAEEMAALATRAALDGLALLAAARGKPL